MASQNSSIKEESDEEADYSDSVFTVPDGDSDDEIDDEDWEALLAAESSEPEPASDDEVVESPKGEAEGSSHAQLESANTAPRASQGSLFGEEEDASWTLERVRKRQVIDFSDDESDQSPLMRRRPNLTKRRRVTLTRGVGREVEGRQAHPLSGVAYPSLPAAEEGSEGDSSGETSSTSTSTTTSMSTAVQTSTPPVVLQPASNALIRVPNGAPMAVPTRDPPGLTLIGSIDLAILIPALATRAPFPINLYVRDADLGGSAHGAFATILQALAHFLRLPRGN
ncbi:uncharacterized protein BDZ99DRAFT_482880 [Mytilinidion resinicola]|uniref:Uncharacterized protein n=1 Tax=Mytilinidion resinicola TaxID=574789 RepID=A0A6A6Y115_9PEZI|nr:uncharacterized protein BDZ99DRAFT_482880 [Mytilinidion resinicola]KAF2802462.1 hypothetical protein BDZ99DRAFT_482880 [Mytilinidion resinicola]